jgi:hypothetical protein
LFVRIVAEALGKTNDLGVPDGPVNDINALFVPPFAPGSIPVTWVVRLTAPDKFVNAGCAQAAVPFAATPNAKLFPVQSLGSAANAVEVAALPVIFESVNAKVLAADPLWPRYVLVVVS